MEKICSIKLVTGEEIVCSVIEIIESDNHTSVAIYNPLKIALRTSVRKGSTKLEYKFSPWLIVDQSDLLEINLNKIITVCEVKDYEILYEYNKQFQKKLNPKPTRNFKKEMGFIGSVEKFRSELERLYRKDSYEKDS